MGGCGWELKSGYVVGVVARGGGGGCGGDRGGCWTRGWGWEQGLMVGLGGGSRRVGTRTVGIGSRGWDWLLGAEATPRERERTHPAVQRNQHLQKMRVPAAAQQLRKKKNTASKANVVWTGLRSSSIAHQSPFPPRAVFMERCPRGGDIATPLLSLTVATPKKK